MIVPFRHKFQWHFERDGKRFYLRVLIGLFMISITRQWEYPAMEFVRASSIVLGWIPLRIEDGGLISPVWCPWRIMYYQEQE